MASRQTQSLVEIDLNVVYSVNLDIEDGGGQEDLSKKTHFYLPDLNIDVEEGSVLDLNFNSNSLTTKISLTSQFLIDLNKMPYVGMEDDINIDEEPMSNIGNIDDDDGAIMEIPQPNFGTDDCMIAENANMELVAPDLNTEEHVNDDNANVEEVEGQSHLKELKTLNNDQRIAIYQILLQKSVDGKLEKGVTKMVASLFSISIRTVQRIWKQLKDSGIGDVSHKKINCGRKKFQIDFAQFREIPLSQRTTFRSLACALNTNVATLFKLVRSGVIRCHSNAIKPLLKEENRRSRLQFCLSMLESGSIPHDPIFISMHNIVHIDEKWFYMTKKSENYYLLSDEEDPLRTCKSKNFIGKVMFLVAIARPRFDAQGNETFSGKIGVFPFVTQEPAKRTSVNRVAGTLETKPIASVKREVIRLFLIEKVIPAIKAKWPREDLRYPIFIQQDNARAHIDHNDNEFRQVATQDGFDIRLMCQPANSPDLNVLDLGFFSAIQSLQYKESPKTIDELVSAVVKSFEAFSTVKSNHIFSTLQLCMIEIMKAKGSNKYKIPYVKKAVLQREGQLPTQMKCESTLVLEVLNYLNTVSY